jgi:pyruvate,orthophosphate dikinase
MLGLRGVRLGLVIPGLFALQIRAIAEATVACFRQRAAKPKPRSWSRWSARCASCRSSTRPRRSSPTSPESVGVHAAIPIGCMIELPRAALTAGEIARSAEFFSFGTNDLTQTTWGFSRDDVESGFFSEYLEKGVLGISPFETLDEEGVGSWSRSASTEGARTKPGPPPRRLR